MAENCKVSDKQPAVSAIPGNIGNVRAKVLVWDNDPFLARPHQHLTFPFSQSTFEQANDEPINIEFQAGTAFLKPLREYHNMFVATRNTVDGSVVDGLDFVGASNTSVGKEAERYLPGGDVFTAGQKMETPNVGPDIFPHQLWIYTGSILKSGVPLHPSEYDKDQSSWKSYLSLISPTAVAIATTAEYFAGWTNRELQTAPKWDYTQIDNDGEKSIWPKMITKPTRGNPVHWTLEKFKLPWQGMDFAVTVRLGNKETVDAIDQDSSEDYFDTNIDDYKYLLFYPETTPANDPNWIDGISNEAYYITSTETLTTIDGQLFVDNNQFEESRKLYWWNRKTYIMIEVGAGDPNNNYFIEIVKGRKPRLIHLGYEWDNPNRAIKGATVDSTGFRYMKKARVISTYNAVFSDELFRRKEFTVFVKNNLGRLVIEFDGFNATPWVITRRDNDPAKTDFSKFVVPMVVPSAPIKIHGGNISCMINFTPTRYVPQSKMLFKNRQADTGPPWKRATNADLYMTFANIGNSVKYKSEAVKVGYFFDPRFGEVPIGYSCDAWSTLEYNRNISTEIELYTFYPDQWRRYGKGFLSFRPRNEDGTTQTLDPTVDLYKPNQFYNTLSPGHKLIIRNGRNEGRSFEFGLSEKASEGYEYKDEVSVWDVIIEFRAGNVFYPLGSDVEEDENIPGSGDYTFKNYVTPIATSWSMYVLGGGKPIKDNVDPIDISSLITSINDGWSADGFTSLKHEMSMKAYIPVGIPTGGEPITDSRLPQFQDDDQFLEDLEEDARFALYEKGQALLKLHNKAFYISVSYWWEDGIGERDAQANLLERSGPPRGSDLLIQMTGVAYGAEIEKSVNKVFLNIKVQDYMSILEKQFIFNSPFFDGVDDNLAVYELAKLAGFDDTKAGDEALADGATVEEAAEAQAAASAGINRRPLSYLQKVIEDRVDDCTKIIHNGEISINRYYDLPMSYADIANPAIRFQNGDTYDSAMKKIAGLSSKILYFDRWGVLRLENTPAIEAAFQSGPSAQNFEPVFRFTTSPFNFASGDTNEDVGAIGEQQTAERFTFDANDAENGASHLVYNVVRFSRSVEDCVNQIVLMSVGNDILLPDGRRTGGYIIEGYTFFDQMWNPNVEGFLGFRKPFYQSNGVFGGIEQIRNGLQHYAKMKYPPAIISFECFGVPGLKALDIIALDDNLFYITEISHEIDPSENRWWMNITGEWLKPFFGDLGFLKERGETESGTGSSSG